MERDIEYITMAIELAKQGVFPYGTVIVKDGKVIGKASSGDGDSYDPTGHAETLAVRNACKNMNTSNLDGATIYSSCEPCFMCFGSIWWSNISRIVYGANIYDSNNILNTDINITIEELNEKTGNHINITGGILKDEAVSVMKNWKEKITISEGVKL